MLDIQANYVPGDEASFEVDDDCSDCACAVGTVEDEAMWETGMCLRYETPCEEPCSVGNVTHPVRKTSRFCNFIVFSFTLVLWLVMDFE